MHKGSRSIPFRQLGGTFVIAQINLPLVIVIKSTFHAREIIRLPDRRWRIIPEENTPSSGKMKLRKQCPGGKVCWVSAQCSETDRAFLEVIQLQRECLFFPLCIIH